MIELEHIKDEFKLYYKGHLFLHHNSDNPCVMIGIGKARYKLLHHKFKIKDNVSEKFELNEFEIYFLNIYKLEN